MGGRTFIKVTQRGIRLHNASFSLTDDKNRSVEIGAAEGLLARDAGGTIIHDIPDAPMSTGNYYCGHILWFENQSTYQLLYDASAWTNFPYNSWKTGISTTATNNSNARAGIFKIIASANWSSGAAQIALYISLRPYGTTWSYQTTQNSPGFGMTVYYDGTNAPAVQGFIMCPLGTDGKIDIYISATAANLNSGGVTITQIGLLI